MSSLTLKIIWLDEDITEVEGRLKYNEFEAIGKGYFNFEDIPHLADNIDLTKLKDGKPVNFSGDTTEGSFGLEFILGDPKGHIHFNFHSRIRFTNDKNSQVSIWACTEPGLLDKFANELKEMKNEVGQRACLELFK